MQLVIGAEALNADYMGSIQLVHEEDARIDAFVLQLGFRCVVAWSTHECRAGSTIALTADDFGARHAFAITEKIRQGQKRIRPANGKSVAVEIDQQKIASGHIGSWAATRWITCDFGEFVFLPHRRRDVGST